jgi:hypothetical protein
VTLLRRSGDSALSGAAGFDERLTVPWWWWVPALGVVGLVAFEVNLGHPGVPLWLPVALGAPLVAWGLHRLGRTRVSLVGRSGKDEPTLRVGRASVPVGLTGAVRVIDKGDKQQALGPDLDPAAFLIHRWWVGPLVRVQLEDPADPTPYWLFSVRHPERLVRRLEAERSP